MIIYLIHFCYTITSSVRILVVISFQICGEMRVVIKTKANCYMELAILVLLCLHICLQHSP